VGRPLKVRFANLLRLVGQDMAARGDRIYKLPEPPPTQRELTLRDWHDARGDKTLRVEYPLDSRSVVLDVGGFEGQWASDIFARYLCRIHVFEPLPEAADAIGRRFAVNPHIKLHRAALGAKAGTAELAVQGDGSSLHAPGERRVAVQVVTPEEVLAAENIGEVALLKINIEGGEYDLLEHLIATGLISRIKDIQVQFHMDIQDAEQRMHDIQSRLAGTHRLTFQYRFLWENWRRLPDAV
jgi:FkbM family methyltransferase